MSPDPKKRAGLTPKQERFCQEYLIDLNATQAAIRAGYSAKTAHEIGAQNLAKLSIAARISELQQERSERTQIKADAVLKELAIAGFGRIADMAKARPDGLLELNFRDATRDQLAIIASIKTKTRIIAGEEDEPPATEVECEVKALDKLKALELLGKHLGLFRDKLEMTGKDGGPIQLQEQPMNLDGLTLEELDLLEKLAERRAAADASHT